MSLHHRICLVVALSLFALSSVSQSKPDNSQPSPLTPVAWFVGGTWVSDVKNPQDGSVTHVENRIDWAPNHQAIEFFTRFNGQPHYNGFYAYNAASKTIVFYYTSSEGELTTGTAVPEQDGKTLRQEFDITHSDGKVSHLRSTIERDGENAYWFTVFMQKDGHWVQEFRIHYERKA